MSGATLDFIDQVQREIACPEARPLLDAVRETLSSGEPLLPPISPHVHQACRLVESPRCDVLELAEAIGRDAALGDRLTAVANSAFFGGSDRVHTVRDAVVRMGIREARNVVVGVALRESFWSVAPFEHALVPLWQHALATAAAAQGILCEVAFDDNSGFLTGLTHDVGRVALLRVVASRPELSALCRAVPAMALDRAMDGMHAEVGARVLDQWDFPMRVVNAVRYHHCPEAVAGTDQTMAAALQTADWMAHRFSETRSCGPLGASPMDLWLDRLGISPQRAERLLEEGRARFDELLKIL